VRTGSTRTETLRWAWRYPFLRFVAVGLLNTAFGYTVYAALVLAGLHRSAALVVATVPSILFNFRTTGLLVFRSRDNGLLLRFVLVYAMSLGFNAALLEFLCRGMGLGPLTGQAAGLPLVVGLTFLAMREFVFRTDSRYGTDAQKSH